MRTEHPLHSFFNPRCIAMIGATEKSIWTRAALSNLKKGNYDAKLFLINRDGKDVLGHSAVSSLSEINEPIDTALIMLPPDAVIDTLPSIKEAGIKNLVLLSSGFGEAGEIGQIRQETLLTFCTQNKIQLLGPNCLGFANFAANTVLWAAPLRAPFHQGGKISIVSQSGATAAQMSFFAHSQGIPLSAMVSTGNESGIDVGAAVSYFAQSENTRAIALFLESVRDVNSLKAAAKIAIENDKAIVVLKVGASEISAKAAQAHTGALVGNDAAFNAACEDMGMIRVDSIEDLIFTSDLLSRTGPLKEGGLSVISMSGGVCEISADHAENHKVPLPEFTAETQAKLTATIDGMSSHNPVDVTGAVMRAPNLFGDVVKLVGDDPNISLVLTSCDLPTSANDDGRFARLLVKEIARGANAGKAASFITSYSVSTTTDITRDVIQETNARYITAGVHHGIIAARAALSWSQRLPMLKEKLVNDTAIIGQATSKPSTEQEVLAYFAQQGIPVIPTLVTSNLDEALQFARAQQQAVALKIASVDIPHKTDIGGVELNIIGDDNVTASFERILKNVGNAKPNANIEGIALSPMRSGGIELFVGIVRDPQWGLLLTLGLGGVWIEILGDISQTLLPVTPSKVTAMLNSLRGAKLLDGYRGSVAVDKTRLASIISNIGNAALELGEDLVSLEVNPLFVSADHIEALDGLAIWSD